MGNRGSVAGGGVGATSRTSSRDGLTCYRSRGMTISSVDWAIVAAYFVLSAAIGLYFTKRGGASLDQYFLSGRQVPWWLAGTAMVATTFAADTPLVVTGLVATKGVTHIVKSPPSRPALAMPFRAAGRMISAM